MANANFWQDFLSHFKKGVMKPNLYEVVFNLPPGVSASSNGFTAAGQSAIASFNSLFAAADGIRSSQLRAAQVTMNTSGSGGGINIKCHTATFPQRTLQTFEIKQNTTPFRAPFSAVYDPITFSFYADATGDTRRYFDLWQQTVFNVKSNTMNFYREFTSDVELYVHNDAGARTYGVKLFEAWPLSVGPLDVSYSQVDNYQSVVTTMAYRRWEQILV